jgi:cobyrinic acid a,c-diamide synthase
MQRLLISAAHKSSGKTTLSIGLCAALHARGVTVQPFKKGPDFIDPMWLSLACDRACHNLDFYLMDHDEILATFSSESAQADISIIEGNKGLYDGLDLDGSNSNAALAELLQTPVVLVIDARGMTRGIAPLILGYQAFDRNINIAGVILNQLGGSRHESKLRAVIEHYTDVPVIGAVHRDERLAIVERHLGLMPSNEATQARTKIDTIARLVAEQVNLELVQAVAGRAPPLSTLHAGITTGTPFIRPGAHATHVLPPDATGAHPTSATISSLHLQGDGATVRIGIARDAAFAFYYPGDLEALQANGAALIPFDTLHDTRLPQVDALFIGGGFPEVHLLALEANIHLRQSIRQAIEAGMPVYAECGGLMYLSRSLSWHGQRADMVGALPADTLMHASPQGRGYVRLRETAHHPWLRGETDGLEREVRAHEFHYSSLENLPPDLHYAYDVMRGAGIDGTHDGIVYKNVLACYAHMRDLSGNHWTRRFVEFIRRHRAQHEVARSDTQAADLPGDPARIKH